MHFSVDAPRGAAVIYLKSDGGGRPSRIKWRTLSFNAVQVMPEVMRGVLYAYYISILGSFDIVLPEVDR